MNATQVVIAFNGGMGSEAEIEIAKSRNCRIIPVTQCNNDLQNKVIKKILDDQEIMAYLNQIDHGYYEKLMVGTVSAEDILSCIKKMLE